VTGFETVASEVELAGLAAGWDDLVRAMPRPCPFLLHGWLVEWWRHHAKGRTLAVQVARRDGRLVGALPLCVSSRYGLRVTEFMGGTAAPLADLVLAPGEDPAVGTGLAERIGSTGGDFADLFGLPGGSRLARALPAGSVTVLERIEAPVLDLRGGWEAVYERRLSSRTRRERARRRRRLEALGRVRISVAQSPDELAARLEDAFRLHALRWQGRHPGPEFSTAVGRAFHRAALRRLAEDDVPRLVTLTVGGRPVAFSLYLLLERTVYGVSMGFNPELARLAPGTETLLCALELAVEEGAERVEFLGAADPYKQALTDRLEPLHQAIGLPSTARGRVAAELLVGGVRARRRLRRSETARRIYAHMPRLGRAGA
jgi:CelD/BcsL family acetyltransferase involved in cellulose biosynthesis